MEMKLTLPQKTGYKKNNIQPKNNNINKYTDILTEKQKIASVIKNIFLTLLHKMAKKNMNIAGGWLFLNAEESDAGQEELG